MIIKKAGENNFFDDEIEMENLQVGERYRIFMENDSNRKNVFLMSEFCVPFSYVQIIATEKGEMPLSVKSHDCSNDWIRGGMGQYELSRNIVKPGYYLIHAVKGSFWDSKKEAEIIISKIESIEHARISSPYINVFIQTVFRIKETEVDSKLEFLQKPVRFVLYRMLYNNITTGSVPKYSKSVGRHYMTRMFTEENGRLVSYHGNSKLILDQDFTDKLTTKFLQIFIPKNQIGNERIKVDGFHLFMVTPSSYEMWEKKAHKQFKRSELHVIETVTGEEFCAIVRNEKIYPLYHSWEGFSMIPINEKERAFIADIKKI